MLNSTIPFVYCLAADAKSHILSEVDPRGNDSRIIRLEHNSYRFSAKAPWFKFCIKYHECSGFSVFFFQFFFAQSHRNSILSSATKYNVTWNTMHVDYCFYPKFVLISRVFFVSICQTVHLFFQILFIRMTNVTCKYDTRAGWKKMIKIQKWILRKW